MNNQSNKYKIHNDLHGADGYMGLNNQLCSDPKYYCKNHLIYMSDKDVELKKCLYKPTFDMIGTTRCRSLITAEEHKKELEAYREDLRKINGSRKNLGMLSYNVKKPVKLEEES